MFPKAIAFQKGRKLDTFFLILLCIRSLCRVQSTDMENSAIDSTPYPCRLIFFPPEKRRIITKYAAVYTAAMAATEMKNQPVVLILSENGR